MINIIYKMKNLITFENFFQPEEGDWVLVYPKNLKNKIIEYYPKKYQEYLIKKETDKL